MKNLLLFASVLLIASCSKDTPKTSDELVGTKWERYAFDQPFNGKPVYARMEFESNGVFKEYFYSDGKYLSEVKTGSYTRSGSDLTLSLNGVITSWEYSSVKIVSKIPGTPIVIYENVL